jgi:hypothetical protein
VSYVKLFITEDFFWICVRSNQFVCQSSY